MVVLIQKGPLWAAAHLPHKGGEDPAETARIATAMGVSCYIPRSFGEGGHKMMLSGGRAGAASLLPPCGGDAGRPERVFRFQLADGSPSMNTLIFRTVAPFLTALMVLFSIFVLLRGHNEPGGGFIGGLIAPRPWRSMASPMVSRRCAGRSGSIPCRLPAAVCCSPPSPACSRPLSACPS